MIIYNETVRFGVECTWYRVLIEVFLKSNFGRNYFSFKYALKIWLNLIFFPIGILAVIYFIIFSLGNDPVDISWGTSFSFLFKTGFITWYIFSFTFLYFSYKRYRALEKSHIINFKKLSGYRGDFNDLLTNFIERKLKRSWNFRQMETIYEPMVFGILGALLIVFGEFIGYLLIYAAYKYHVLYKRAFKVGDNHLQGIADRLQMQEWDNYFHSLSVEYYFQASPVQPKSRRTTIIVTEDEKLDPPSS